jgi:hypothetical protein
VGPVVLQNPGDPPLSYAQVVSREAAWYAQHATLIVHVRVSQVSRIRLPASLPSQRSPVRQGADNVVFISGLIENDNGPQVALLDVLEVFKGAPGPTLNVRQEWLNPCGIGFLKKGEEWLLFLEKNGSDLSQCAGNQNLAVARRPGYREAFIASLRKLPKDRPVQLGK